jgi:hypothetical protein
MNAAAQGSASASGRLKLLINGGLVAGALELDADNPEEYTRSSVLSIKR